MSGALAAFARQQPAEALAELRAARHAERDWSTPAGQVLARGLAYGLLGLGRPSEARETLALMTDAEEVATRLAEISWVEGTPGALRAACERGLVSLGPARLEDTQHWLAGVSGDAVCEARLRAHPLNANRRPLVGHAEGLRVRGRADEAASELQAIVRRDASAGSSLERDKASISYARLQADRGDLPAAIRELERARQTHDSDPFALLVAARRNDGRPARQLSPSGGSAGRRRAIRGTTRRAPRAGGGFQAGTPVHDSAPGCPVSLVVRASAA